MLGPMPIVKWIFLLLLRVAGQAAAPFETANEYVAIHGVFLNGEGPFRFLVDTGAESTTLSARLAERLSLRPSYRVEVDSVNGTQLVPAAIVTRVNAGNATAWNVEVLWHVLSLESVDGILGQSFLSRFRLLLDYEAGRATFEPEQAPRGGVRLPLERLAGRPTVRAGLQRLVLDSGTPRLILFKAPRRHGRERQGFHVAGVLPGLPPAQGETGLLESLTLGALTLRGVPFVHVENSGRQEDGLLPLSLFSWVYLDPHSGIAVFSPRLSGRR